MWLEVLKHVAKKLQKSKAAPRVMLGAVNPARAEVTSAGTILLVRGNETSAEEDRGELSIVTIYLEAWVRDDAPDMVKGYERLAKLEAKIDAALNELREQAGRLDEAAAMISPALQLVDIQIDTKTGDMDSMRPLVGTQYSIQVKVFKQGGGIW